MESNQVIINQINGDDLNGHAVFHLSVCFWFGALVFVHRELQLSQLLSQLLIDLREEI